MPPLAAADDFLILEFIAGNRRISHAVFDSLLASLSSPYALPRTSQRLRQALVLRALDAALHTEGTSSCSSLLLHKARKVLADPDAAACFPHQISFADNEENDEARAAAAVADLKRLLDLEWANLPPSTLERAADRIAGDGAHQTRPAADHTKRTKRRLLVGESTEREILSKLVQDGSTSHQPILTEVADNASNANEADGARRDDEAHSFNENSEADCGREGMAGHQNASVKGAEGRVSEKAVPASKKCSLMERNPNASTYEWDSSDDDQPVRKRKVHHFERKSYPSPSCAHKIRKKWSEIEEKTLLEGVEKYGKGNWKDIKLAYPDVFEERSTVDLKDKFRNLERRHHESAC
ncbi:telomere repeat-binding protein 2-like isoform X2 [Miscanthus floridulus]|uniref:telomere repeat-binding protein 2-like isoform X2 n=1 Tax=Miscanthus floridulus TaxID=154761 RepID=UPI00345A57B7